MLIVDDVYRCIIHLLCDHTIINIHEKKHSEKSVHRRKFTSFVVPKGAARLRFFGGWERELSLFDHVGRGFQLRLRSSHPQDKRLIWVADEKWCVAYDVQ